MFWYKTVYLFKRALGGIRRRPWLHFFSILTLTATFLSFTTTLTAAINLDHLLERWIGTAQLTVYIKEGVNEKEIEKLVSAIKEIPQVARIEATTPENARLRFSKDMGQYQDMVAALPVSAFPASVDVHLTSEAARSERLRGVLAKRIEKVAMVEEVNQYDEWFEKLSAITTIGRAAAWGLGLLALVVSILVVASVIKAGVTSRAREIEVLGFVGASKRYIRLPFELEGAIEAAIAMTVAVIVLFFLSSYVQSTLKETLPIVGMGNLISLEIKTTLLLIAGSAFTGLIGSKLSLRGVQGA